MTIQHLIGGASEDLSKAYEIFKASQQALKDLKKDLKKELKNNSEWIEKEMKVKLFKASRKEIQEQIKELQREQDQIAVGLDQYQVVQDFMLTMEEKFFDKKDKVLNKLSRDLFEKGISTELEYTKGQLKLVVAKHNNY